MGAREVDTAAAASLAERAAGLQARRVDPVEHAFHLWCWYYLETETYDRMVCTGPIEGGCIHPMNPEEMGRIQRNAALTARLVLAEEHRLGITPEESRRGKEQAQLFEGRLEDLRRYAQAPHRPSSLPPVLSFGRPKFGRRR